jgi:hypothetical protein
MNRNGVSRLNVIGDKSLGGSLAINLLRSGSTAAEHVKNTHPASDVKGSERWVRKPGESAWNRKSCRKAP